MTHYVYMSWWLSVCRVTTASRPVGANVPWVRDIYICIEFVTHYVYMSWWLIVCGVTTASRRVDALSSWHLEMHWVRESLWVASLRHLGAPAREPGGWGDREGASERVRVSEWASEQERACVRKREREREKKRERERDRERGKERKTERERDIERFWVNVILISRVIWYVYVHINNKSRTQRISKYHKWCILFVTHCMLRKRWVRVS